MCQIGCATITRGTKEVLVIESEPSGANVTTSTGLAGKTPATFKVSRKGGFVVTIEKPGYETVTVQVSSQVAGGGAAGMAGNIVLGGLIGAAVDAGSGAMLQLKPNPITVKLEAIGTADDKSDAPISTDTEVGGDNTQDTPEPKDSIPDGQEKEKQSYRIHISPLNEHEVQVCVLEVG